MKIRDRIVALERVRAADLVPNPKNWRVHPEKQKAAIKGILAEVGYVDAVLARRLPDGRLMLVDGHLRAETTPEQHVPVLVLDVNEAEADKLLLSLDPLSAMADTDTAALKQLLESVDAASQALAGMFVEMGDAAGIYKQQKTDAAAGSREVDVSAMEMEHCCPECGFEFNDKQS